MSLTSGVSSSSTRVDTSVGGSSSSGGNGDTVSYQCICKIKQGEGRNIESNPGVNDSS